ncbi:uncharacterized protein V1518DRAFT_17845 [Limtongia smithiae]|uniref:uncharacterized protein n=1 Tax=Limtongia smithiae TaxID=1125753 RepID=UPI0034CED4A9
MTTVQSNQYWHPTQGRQNARPMSMVSDYSQHVPSPAPAPVRHVPHLPSFNQLPYGNSKSIIVPVPPVQASQSMPSANFAQEAQKPMASRRYRLAHQQQTESASYINGSSLPHSQQHGHHRQISGSMYAPEESTTVDSQYIYDAPHPVLSHHDSLPSQYVPRSPSFIDPRVLSSYTSQTASNAVAHGPIHRNSSEVFAPHPDSPVPRTPLRSLTPRPAFPGLTNDMQQDQFSLAQPPVNRRYSTMSAPTPSGHSRSISVDSSMASTFSTSNYVRTPHRPDVDRRLSYVGSIVQPTPTRPVTPLASSKLAHQTSTVSLSSVNQLRTSSLEQQTAGTGQEEPSTKVSKLKKTFSFTSRSSSEGDASEKPRSRSIQFGKLPVQTVLKPGMSSMSKVIDKLSCGGNRHLITIDGQKSAVHNLEPTVYDEQEQQCTEDGSSTSGDDTLVDVPVAGPPKRASSLPRSILKNREEGQVPDLDSIPPLTRRMSTLSTTSSTSTVHMNDGYNSFNGGHRRNVSRASSAPGGSVSFSPHIKIYATWNAGEYDRTKSDPSASYPQWMIDQIKKEVNVYKTKEMEIHENSRCYTYLY